MRLHEWSICLLGVANNIYCVAEGYVSGHTKFSDGTFITTSYIEKMSYNSRNGFITILTHSMHEYVLSLSEISFADFEETQRSLARFGGICIRCEDCKKASYPSIKEAERKASYILKCKELYLQMVGTHIINAVFKDDKGFVKQCIPKLERGLPEDIYHIEDKGIGLDFKYWDDYAGVRPCYWGNNLSAVQIENIGSFDVIVSLGSIKLICKPHSAITIDKSTYIKEKY